MTTTLTIGRTIYQVERHKETDDISVAYTLTGPRGAVYNLLRNQPNPTMLFATNGRSFTKGTPFDGEWFRDGGPEDWETPLTLSQ